MKDPAFLFYPSDFNDGTQDFTNEEVGAYIRLLLFQFSQGHLPLERIRKKLAPDFERLWNVVQVKFVVDDAGLYFNKRLDDEKNRRKKYSDSRRKNISSRYVEDMKNISATYVAHMENENTVLDIYKDKGLLLSKIDAVKTAFDNDYLLDGKIVNTTGFSAEQLSQARKEFWGQKALDEETTLKPYSDVQLHFLRWSAQNKERIKRQVSSDFESGGMDDSVDIMKRFEELKNRKND